MDANPNFEGSCGKGVWEKPRLEACDIGLLHERPESSIVQVRDWLKFCDQAHSFCQVGSEARFPQRLVGIESNDSTKVRLLDGAGISLSESYVTLSYRWGNVASDEYVTTSSNLEQRKTGFALQSLPKHSRMPSP